MAEKTSPCGKLGVTDSSLPTDLEQSGSTFSRLKLALFAGPAIPISALGLPLVVYLPPFYAEHVGIELAVVGTIFMVTRLWDVFTDPVLGVISDKYRSRFGRRRHWIVLSVPILLFCVYKVFVPPEGATSTYLLTWMLVLYIGWTLLTISHMSWGAELSTNYHERTKIQGWREFALVFGMFSVLTLPAIIERVTEGGSATKVASMGWFIIILLPLTVGLAVWKVPELPARQEPSLGWLGAMKLVVRNRLMRRVLLADVLVGVGPGMTGSLYIFFVTHVLELGDRSSLILLLYFIAGFAGIPIWLRVSYRLGKHRTLAISMFYACVTLLPALIWKAGNFWGFMAGNMLYGFAYGAGPFLLRSITADVCDLDQVESGAQRTGLFYSLLTMSNKIGFALSVGLTYPLLSWIGFDPKVENSPEALQHLRYLFVIAPVTFMLAAGLVMWGFPLDEKKQREIREKLAGRVVNPAE